jgi:hypothetical protein
MEANQPSEQTSTDKVRKTHFDNLKAAKWAGSLEDTANSESIKPKGRVRQLNMGKHFSPTQSPLSPRKQYKSLEPTKTSSTTNSVEEQNVQNSSKNECVPAIEVQCENPIEKKENFISKDGLLKEISKDSIKETNSLSNKSSSSLMKQKNEENCKKSMEIKKEFDTSMKPNEEFSNKILAIKIGRCDEMVFEQRPFISNPIVKIHLVDSNSGMYLKKCGHQAETISPVNTRPFEFQKHCTLMPIWNETILIDDDYLNIVQKNHIMFFEVLDKLNDNLVPIAWYSHSLTKGLSEVDWKYRVCKHGKEGMKSNI